MSKAAKEFFKTIGTVVVACVLTLSFTTFVAQRTVVSGSSMEPNFSDGDNVITEKLTYRKTNPARYDVIVCPAPDSVGGLLIKRIVGLPGETVQIKENGSIYIDGEVLEETYGAEVVSPDSIGRAKEKITLGEGEYFVLGDNRNNSMDSRSELVGNIKREDIVGKVCFRFWPLSKAGKITGPDIESEMYVNVEK